MKSDVLQHELRFTRKQLLSSILSFEWNLLEGACLKVDYGL
jgi:hypothetical protein